MKYLKTSDYTEMMLKDKHLYNRIAARGIVLKEEDILLIYTKRYNDYSLPGGGIDEGENIEMGLIRELEEETGAKDIKILEGIGIYEEHRPTHYEGYDLMHMKSYCYLCDANKELGEAKPESYELSNGSAPVWVNIHEAIAFNKQVMKIKNLPWECLYKEKPFY